MRARRVPGCEARGGESLPNSDNGRTGRPAPHAALGSRVRCSPACPCRARWDQLPEFARTSDGRRGWGVIDSLPRGTCHAIFVSIACPSVCCAPAGPRARISRTFGSESSPGIGRAPAALLLSLAQHSRPIPRGRPWQVNTRDIAFFIHLKIVSCIVRRARACLLARTGRDGVTPPTALRTVSHELSAPRAITRPTAAATCHCSWQSHWQFDRGGYCLQKPKKTTRVPWTDPLSMIMPRRRVALWQLDMRRGADMRTAQGVAADRPVRGCRAAPETCQC